MIELLSYCTDVAIQVGILFILIGVGVAVAKIKMITKIGIDQIIDILLYVVTPCLIIDAFLSVEFSTDTMTELAIAAGCAFLTHVIGAVAALVFIKVKPISKQSVYRFGVMVSNGGFMSLPMAQALVGDKGVFLVSMYVIVLNVITWTYGITLFKSEQKSSKFKALFNPGTVGVMIGLPLFLLNIHLPNLVAMPIEYLATLNTPMAMIVTGYFLYHSHLKEGLKDGKMWIATVLRLVVVPLSCVIIFKYGFKLSGDLLICCIIPACAPTAVNTIMMSAKFGGDTALSSRQLSISTILSVITMPLLLMLAKM